MRHICIGSGISFSSLFHTPTMPRNKEALIRYRIINRLLLEKKSVTMEEMKKACERAFDRAPLGLRAIAGDIHIEINN